MGDVTTMPVRGDWTVDDLDQLPDDGLRYELVDGVLLVSPSPAARHQLVLFELLMKLGNACPPDLRVLPAPLDIRFTRTRLLQPDIVVLQEDQVRSDKVTGLPLLAVEVLSPSTRATDMTLKRHVFEEGGVPAYWLVDPDGPTLTVLELDGASYRETLSVHGDEAAELTVPFAVRIVPAELIR